MTSTLIQVVCIVFICVCFLVPGPCSSSHVEAIASSGPHLDVRNLRKDLYRLRRDLLEALVESIEVDLQEFPEIPGVEAYGVDIKDDEAGPTQPDVVESDAVDSMAIAAVADSFDTYHRKTHRPKQKKKSGEPPVKTPPNPNSKTSQKKARKKAAMEQAKLKAMEKAKQKDSKRR